MLIIGHRDVEEILAARPELAVEAVRDAYRMHDAGYTSVPHSTFLRFPGDNRNRIIGLPAFVGGEQPAAGMKWIASFPENLRIGLPRANATIVLNTTTTGRPVAMLEGSLISAARTAASAALGAAVLTGARTPDGIGVIGCGLINFEVLRYVRHLLPTVAEAVVFDVDPARAENFAARVRDTGLAARVAPDTAAAMAAHPLISIATNAVEPHMNLDACAPGSTVLHLSLRDLHPESLIGVRNVVDDAGHALRENTSLHLAEQLTGHRRFVTATIGALLRGIATLPDAPGTTTVFSPFGLGALDIALARQVLEQAHVDGRGTAIADFLPEPEFSA